MRNFVELAKQTWFYLFLKYVWLMGYFKCVQIVHVLSLRSSTFVFEPFTSLSSWRGAVATCKWNVHFTYKYFNSSKIHFNPGYYYFTSVVQIQVAEDTLFQAFSREKKEKKKKIEMLFSLSFITNYK